MTNKLDATDMDMIRRGDMLGTSQGARVAAYIERLERERDELTKALTRSVTALDDWLNVYASDHCDEARATEAWDRIMKYGTIGYIAHVQEANRAALNHTDGDA